MKIIFRGISWIFCFCLRINIAVSRAIVKRLRSGPQPRLALALDEEIIAEARKRGLHRRKRSEREKTERQPTVICQRETAVMFPVDAAEEDIAIKGVAELQRLPVAEARKLVGLARQAISGPATAQDLILAAIKKAS